VRQRESGCYIRPRPLLDIVCVCSVRNNSVDGMRKTTRNLEAMWTYKISALLPNEALARMIFVVKKRTPRSYARWAVHLLLAQTIGERVAVYAVSCGGVPDNKNNAPMHSFDVPQKYPVIGTEPCHAVMGRSSLIRARFCIRFRIPIVRSQPRFAPYFHPVNERWDRYEIGARERNGVHHYRGIRGFSATDAYISSMARLPPHRRRRRKV
jgi:hypothetical protein